MITILQDVGGDWQALYKDRIRVEQNHSISAHQVLDALGIDYDEIEVPEGGEYPEVLL